MKRDDALRSSTGASPLFAMRIDRAMTDNSLKAVYTSVNSIWVTLSTIRISRVVASSSLWIFEDGSPWSGCFPA